jgi:anaerobic magnesium-protoporphyrin IX monomethyl ester cyclase
MDSDDLCIMFKAAYTTEFYRAVRDALHLEVDAWSRSDATRETRARVGSLWRTVIELELKSRNPDAFGSLAKIVAPKASAFVPLAQLS